MVPSLCGMPWSNIIMSCWIMPSHFGSGYLPEPAGDSIALQILALRHVGARAVQSGLFVVPEREADGPLGLHIRAAEDARQFHHQRSAGAIVIGGLAPADAIHMAATMYISSGMRGADLGAVTLLRAGPAWRAANSVRGASHRAASADRY